MVFSMYTSDPSARYGVDMIIAPIIIAISLLIIPSLGFL